MTRKQRGLDRKSEEVNSDKILVFGTSAAVITRGRGPTELDVSKLAENVQEFLKKIEKILQSAPAAAGGFMLTEFEVSAEISASGKLGLLGTGVEVGGKGGLTFKFQKK